MLVDDKKARVAERQVSKKALADGAEMSSPLQKLDESLVRRALDSDEAQESRGEDVSVVTQSSTPVEKQHISAGAAAYGGGPLIMKPSEPEDEDDKPDEKAEKLKEQKERQRLLITCEPILMANLDTLAMEDYPSDRQLAEATRFRDVWVTGLSVFFFVFVLGILEWVPAWVAGSGFGLFVATALLAWPPFRVIFYSGPVRRELLDSRKNMEFRALGHVRLLEGGDGLLWKVSGLTPYNANLRKRLFVNLMNASKNRTLIKIVNHRRVVRAYMQVIIEAQAAYEKLQKEYFKQQREFMDVA